LARLRAGYWTIDDAGITYAASYEFADHGSLAAYIEGTPVESYSNPLLFFVVALLRLCGLFDPVRTHLHLEMLVFATMSVLVWSMLRAWTREVAAVLAALMFIAIELLTPATWAWYGSGLENVWVSAGLVTLIWICERTARGKALSPAWGAVAFLVAITRPEAPVYVAAFYGALLIISRPSETPLRQHIRRVAIALAVTVALYVIFLCWRRLGYGDWWPNTFYAKVSGNASLSQHFRDYVLGQVFRYAWSLVFALSVLALLLAAELERIAYLLLVFLAASLALPITAGADWMGEHRFATSFFVVSHVAYAAFLAVCVARFLRAQQARVAALATLGAALIAPTLLLYERVAQPETALNEVTLGHIAHDQGGVRWLHQMRLGLPYPLVMVPDAGGSLLVGGMQFIDSASLADFQLSRILRDSPAIAGRLLNQYQHEEKRPDLIHFNPNSAAVDASYLGTHYLRNESHLAVRRDLVQLSSVDSAATLLFDDPALKIYVSPDTVRRSAPGALVRCELIIAWNGGAPPPSTHVGISILGGDHDEISLAPYQADALTGIERRGMLIGAPRVAGKYSVTFELSRDGHDVVRGAMFDLQVTSDTRDLEQTAADLVRTATPQQAVRRVAWLREQMLPRFSTQYLQVVLRALYRGRVSGGDVGRNIARFRWNARLAELEPLPESIRTAENAAARNLFATCPGAGASDSLRVLCLGRVVDELRRLGYLGIVARVPAIADELRQARERAQHASLDDRYRILVALTLADPSDIELQRSLLATRRAVALAGPFPAL
jgi:hypothetical protein